ncbi:MAG: phosphoribosyl-AMP cyclohydrolase [Opitutales bacterium]|nr:phosphoribosyl-AMP cyclohydrolase [Opitutales bacterium]NRA27860.1 phosphoribosyl-AMP cyclohydrolase [Opitutales bacterium]
MNQHEREEDSTLELDFSKLKKVAECGQDLIPAVAQNASTGEVLMVGYANETALNYTRESGLATFWSSSRNELWIKGKTSGDSLHIEDIRVNCEQNSILYLVRPQGKGTCHTKDETGTSRSGCYYRRITDDGSLSHL